MLKKVLTYSFGEMLVKGVSFLALPLYSYMITPYEYGMLGLLNAIMAYLPLLLTFNYLYAFVRLSVEYPNDKLISTFFFLGLGLNVFYIAVGLLLYNVIILVYDIPFYYFILSMLATASIFIFQIMQMHHRSQQMATSYVRYSFIYVILGTALNLSCLYIFEDNVFAMLLAPLLNAVMLSALAYKKVSSDIAWKYFDRHLAIRILQFTLPLILGLVSLLVLAQADKLVLEQFLDREKFGIYVFAFTIALSMGYLGSALFASYQPIFYEKMHAQKQEDIAESFWKIISMVIVGLLLVLVVINVVYFFSNKEYMAGLGISSLIAVSYAFLAFTKIMELHITYVNKTSLLSYIYGSGSFLYLAMLYIFIPNHYMLGAVFALIVTTFMISLAMYYVAQRYCHIRYDRRLIAGYYILMCTIIGVVVNV